MGTEIKMEYDELYHHGILGMRWGIRRYQNKDGSLTKAGKRRRDSEDKSNEPKKTSTPVKKSLSDMSDDEIKQKINRMTMEKQAYMLEKDIAVLNPPKVSKGKQFVSSLFNNVIGPAAKDAGKTLLTDYMKKVGKDVLGLNIKEDSNALDVLKKEVEKLRLEKDKKELTKQDPLSDIKSKVEKAKLEKELSDLTNPKKDEYAEMAKEIKNHATTKAYNKMKEELQKEAEEQLQREMEEQRKREMAGKYYISGLLEPPKER